MKHFLVAWFVLALSLGAGKAEADGQKLRIISWADYVPADLIAAFKKETGIDVELTLSNNEEMISKLRATGGTGYDLRAALSGSHARAAQRNSASTSPSISPSSSWTSFSPTFWTSSARTPLWTARCTDCLTCGAPMAWWSTPSTPRLPTIPICAGPTSKPQNRRPPEAPDADGVRIAAAGKDPFALYGDPKAYGALMDQVGAALIACKQNFKFFYDNKDQLLNGIRSGEVVAAMMWDTGGWTLNRDNPEIQFIVPRSGALGWLDTFALPARGRNDAAAYAWINFTMRPENAARVVKSVGSFSTAMNTAPLIDPRLKAQFAAAFPNNDLKRIHWYPAIPPGLEELEGRVLDRVKAAN